MNQVIENILSRRSVRSFTEEKLTREQIEILLEVARYAPSGANKQSWKFTAILNQNIIEELISTIGTVTERTNYSFYNGTALIIPSNLRDSKWGQDDNACAMENIALAAHSMGLGSLWINQLHGICDHPEIRALLSKLEIPEEHIIYGFAVLGYPATSPKKDVEKKINHIILE